MIWLYNWYDYGRVCFHSLLTLMKHNNSCSCNFIPNRIQLYNTVCTTKITNSRMIIDIVMWFCWWPPEKPWRLIRLAATCVSQLGHHCFWYLPVTCWVPSHYLKKKKKRLIRHHRILSRKNSSEHSVVFIHKNIIKIKSLCGGAPLLISLCF